MHITRKLLVPALAVALGLLAAPVNQAAAAAAPVSGLTSFHQLEVAGDHVFLTGAPDSGSGIVVTSLSGKHITTLDPGSDVSAMTLRDSTLYAKLTSGPDANSIISVPASGSTFTQKVTSLLGGLIPSGLSGLLSALGSAGKATGTAATGTGGIRATGSGSVIDVYNASGALANVLHLGSQTLAAGGLAWAGSTLIAVTRDATTGLYGIQSFVDALTGGSGKTPVPLPVGQTPARSPKPKAAQNSAPLPTVLTVSTDRNEATYDPTFKVTADLGPTLSNRTVAIYEQMVGSAKKLLKKGTVNALGQLSANFTAPYSTTFTAVYSGDSLNQAKTATKSVTVLAKTSLSIAGYYGSTSQGGTTYREYHRGSDILANIEIGPNKSGQCVWVEGQEYYNGTWNANMKSSCADLNSASKLYGYLTAINSDPGYPYRIAVHYLPSRGDKRNAGSTSAWQYILPEN